MRRATRSLARQLADVRLRLAEAEKILRAIRNGEVDAVMGAGTHGSQVFTLQGADQPYRNLIESMNEGALTLSSDKTILYANQCFALMVKCPLEQVVGSSFRRFLAAGDRARLKFLMRRPDKAGGKIQVALRAGNGSQVHAQISVRPLRRSPSGKASVSLVVTDMTEARRSEEQLRALAQRVVQAQEAERGRVALELHDNITQMLCAGLFRSRALEANLPARGRAARKEALELSEMLGKAADEVERISRDLRPGPLDMLGLEGAVRASIAEFEERTGRTVSLACTQSEGRLPADIELALYRILQESLRNVEKFARARHVTVGLTQHDSFVQLLVKDDGVGFDPEQREARPRAKARLGLLGMRERAAYVGGTLEVKSGRRSGTEIDVRVPLAPKATGPRA
jgi:PAS domain S-box-containing protein